MGGGGRMGWEWDGGWMGDEGDEAQGKQEEG